MIKTVYVYPPIPIRSFDWMATWGAYDLGCTQGFGSTEQEAIDDLKSQMEDLTESNYGN